MVAGSAGTKVGPPPRFTQNDHSGAALDRRPFLGPPLRRVGSGVASQAVTFRNRVGRLQQFLTASGQIHLADSTRRKIEQPEESRDAHVVVPKRPHRVWPLDPQITRSLTPGRRHAYGPAAAAVLLAHQVVTICLRLLTVPAVRRTARKDRSRTVVRRALRGFWDWRDNRYGWRAHDGTTA